MIRERLLAALTRRAISKWKEVRAQHCGQGPKREQREQRRKREWEGEQEQEWQRGAADGQQHKQQRL